MHGAIYFADLTPPGWAYSDNADLTLKQSLTPSMHAKPMDDWGKNCFNWRKPPTEQSSVWMAFWLGQMRIWEDRGDET